MRSGTNNMNFLQKVLLLTLQNSKAGPRKTVYIYLQTDNLSFLQDLRLSLQSFHFQTRTTPPLHNNQQLSNNRFVISEDLTSL